MATVQLTERNFEEITGSGIVLVDWWAGWCGPCRMFAPIFEAASERHGDVVFAKVDTEEERGLAGAFAIRSIPTLMAFREGILVFAQPGLLRGPVLDQLIEEVKRLDMDEVRRMIDVKEAGEPGSDEATG
jgi:thioredoxin 1